MDALKRAEEAKRKAESAAGRPQPAAAPSVPDPMPRERLPDIQDRLELVDEQLAEGHVRHSPAPSISSAQAYNARADEEAATQRQRQAAQNLFSAKQPVRRHRANWAIGIGTFVGLLAVAGYLWYQFDAASNRGLVALPPSASAPPAALPFPAQTLPSSQISPSPATPSPAQNPAAPVSAPGAAAPLIAQPETRANPTPVAPRPPRMTAAERRTLAEHASPSRQPRPAPSAKITPMERSEPQEVPTATRPVAPHDGIQISRGREASSEGLTTRAWRALQAGDLASARQDYQEALRRDTRSTDALLGLATVAQREGKGEQAEQYYRRALDVDPQNSVAQASLINLKGQDEAGNPESRLKTMLASAPDAPHLNFSLGNLYARQGRWSDAQQAYFKAYSGDAENPDYLYNLAISLDHLRQTALATQYYQNALAAAARRPANFDRGRLEARLRDLQPAR